MNCTVTGNTVHQGSGLQTPPAHKRTYSACDCGAGLEVLNQLEFQQGQLLLLMRNAFLVLVLGFDVVDIGCRNGDSSKIVCTGVVHDFQNGQLATASDPSSSFSVTVFARISLPPNT